jgi:heptaprenylglyceryl phosphate synthase
MTFWNSLTGNVTISGSDYDSVHEQYLKLRQAYKEAGSKVGDPATAPDYSTLIKECK